MSRLSSARELDWPREHARVQDIREQVFTLEQRVDPALQWDGNDPHCRHIVIEAHDGRVVAYGRLSNEGKIGRLAVRSELRGQGLGLRVLNALLELARQNELPRVYLHAQARALRFYERAGFSPSGAPFEEAGIEHLRMSRALDAADTRRIAYRTDFSRHLIELASSASRHLAILSPALDAAVFDQRNVSDALAGLARRSRESMIRILVSDPRPIVQRSHRLLQLSRRLPSRVKLHCLARHPEWRGQTLVVRDNNGTAFKPGDSDHDAFVNSQSRAYAQGHAELFDELWRKSAPDPEFRSFSL